LPKVFLLGAASMAIAVLWTTLSGTSYWTWFISQTQFQSTYQHLTLTERALTWLQTIYLAFRPEGVLLAIVGILVSKKDATLKTFATMLIGLAGFLVLTPGVVDYRYTFILFPAVLPLAGMGTIAIGEYVSRLKLLSGHIAKNPSWAKLISCLIMALLVAYYVVETNRIALRFLSFPWKPYVTPD